MLSKLDKIFFSKWIILFSEGILRHKFLFHGWFDLGTSCQTETFSGANWHWICGSLISLGLFQKCRRASLSRVDKRPSEIEESKGEPQHLLFSRTRGTRQEKHSSSLLPTVESSFDLVPLLSPPPSLSPPPLSLLPLPLSLFLSCASCQISADRLVIKG